MSMKKTAVFIFIAVIVLAAAGGYFMLSGGKGKKGKDKAAVKTEKAGEKASNNVNDVAKANAFDPGPLPDGRNLFIMGWDGAGWRNVELLLKEGKLPNLSKLINSTGKNPFPIDLHGRTCTRNTWVRIFTGLDDDQTGVNGNPPLLENGQLRIKEYDKWNKNINIFINYGGFIRVIPYEHTIMEALQKDLNFKIGWFVSKPLGYGEIPTPLTSIRENADDSFFYGPKAGSNVKSNSMDDDSSDKSIKDEHLDVLGEKTINFIKNAKSPFVVFFLADPDAYGHLYDENHKRYLMEFERADAWLGKIIAVLDENTYIMVLSDHGFDEGRGSHHNASDAWGWTSLPLYRGYFFAEKNEKQRAVANARDIGTTILDFYGIEWKKRGPIMRGKSLLD